MFCGKKSSSKLAFRDKWRNDCCTVLRDVNEFPPALSIFIDRVWRNSIQEKSHVIPFSNCDFIENTSRIKRKLFLVNKFHGAGSFLTSWQFLSQVSPHLVETEV
jgi:hypothetical protein